MVRLNVAFAAAQVGLLTLMVRVMTPPLAASVTPKV